ncbi:MAG: hypothetical protein ABJK25_16375 [Halieaceae bacterium]
MIMRERGVLLAPADDHVLIYAALFMVCALMSALGGGWLGIASFVPAAIVIEIALGWRRQFGARESGSE